MIRKIPLHWQVILCMLIGALFGYFLNPHSVYLNLSASEIPDQYAAINIFYESIIFLGVIFMRLLKMIIIPLIFTSIILGISSISSRKKIGRLGVKTFIYYISTSLIAICIGLTLANIIRPGDGAVSVADVYDNSELSTSGSLLDIIERMIPTNIFDSFASGISVKEWKKLLNNQSKPFSNRAIQSSYPPGSIFKLILASIVLEEKIINEKWEVNCTGEYQFYDQ